MKKRVLAIVLVGALGGPVTINAATDEVSPKLARKAVYWLYTDSGNKPSKDGSHVWVSEPKVYYNYDRTLKYYAFYIYEGPWEMPTWKELEERADKGERVSMMGLYSVIIAGNKNLPPYLKLASNAPAVIAKKKWAKGIVEGQFPGRRWRFRQAFIEAFLVYFVFISGGEEIVISEGGSIVNPKGVRFKIRSMEPSAIKKNRKKWAEIEEFVENPEF